jgi:DNA repair protein RecO (recombination protein O)
VPIIIPLPLGEREGTRAAGRVRGLLPQSMGGAKPLTLPLLARRVPPSPARGEGNFVAHDDLSLAMQWDDDAIILSARAHGETSLILQLLTGEHGRHGGLVRGARRARGRGVYETGNRVAAHWQARLADHLGLLRCELVRGYAAELIDDPTRLACLAAAASLAETVLPEREAAPGVFAGLSGLLDALAGDRGWQEAYVAWELALLAELGFGLDLSRCAATGATTDLAYVSPKSAQAVSRAAGAPYGDKLLPLPAFLLAGGSASSAEEVRDGLALTGYFLNRHLFEPLGHKTPPARARFVDRMGRGITISGADPTKFRD